MFFCQDTKNRYIPRISRDFLHSLTFEGYPDQLGTKPVTTICEERKRAIEVSASHADAVPSGIECDERSDDNVEFVRVDKRA